MHDNDTCLVVPPKKRIKEPNNYNNQETLKPT